jgi:hypothetical protein
MKNRVKMKTSDGLRVCLFMAGLLLAGPQIQAQSYTVPWYKIGGGGGSSSNGQFSLTGAIGQPEAGSATGQTNAGTSLSGGNFSLIAGFWSLIAVQTPGAPFLTINASGNLFVLSWPAASTGWTLQTNRTLTVGTWGNYGGAISNNCVTNSPPAGNLFFRLWHP